MCVFSRWKRFLPLLRVVIGSLHYRLCYDWPNVCITRRNTTVSQSEPAVEPWTLKPKASECKGGKNQQQNVQNRPHSIYQYSIFDLSGHNCKFFKFLLSLNSQKRLGYKENNTKYRSLTWKPRSHVRVSIYRTWLVQNWRPRRAR